MGLDHADPEPGPTIIDSHIHLFAKTHINSLAWQSPEGPLYSQYSVAEYRHAMRLSPLAAPKRFKGFVFVEADRKSSVSEVNGGWTQPIEELKFISRVISGHPVPGEGHGPEDTKICLAAVGWAPVPGGRDAMKRYVERVRSSVGDDMMQKVVGWRYLVQTTPRGTMLKHNFIDSLRWMGENRYSFDLGVDCRSGGLWQLQEAVEMIRRVVVGIPPSEQVVIVINHMCKPNMRLKTVELEGHDEFQAWKAQIAAFAAFPNTYMKLSGVLSEMPPIPKQTEREKMSFWERQASLKEITRNSSVWMDVALDAFSPHRCMFGSDWPVCNIGGGGDEMAAKCWVHVMQSFLATLEPEAQAQIWGLTAAKVYKIRLD